ncbi:HAD family hydrolase [Saccharospirillum salsuginis]|uniref:phosphoglycolate phosphatase n=1 Tax=Saccharospirillum salsuginis TaxID=418750 RepID=A0A918KEF4_9GAMM|nr:HAD family hydrolase [Saccharospirillum salsuginis]GGX60337.1 haloacid dehalogenase [Saccharospirillum salsuginis]
MKFTEYDVIFFDCDGVVLNSNSVKTDAFYRTALPYGVSAAERLVEYHVNNGGISRYKKFRVFMDQILELDGCDHGLEYEQLLRNYASYVKEGLLSCEVTPYLEQLRELSPGAEWMIVSGGDQNELNDVFKKRGLIDLFDGGIYGSPDSKHEILSRELCNRKENIKSLFLGDSRYDHQVAREFGVDFIFISGWSEFSGWEDYCKTNSISQVELVKDIMVP